LYDAYFKQFNGKVAYIFLLKKDYIGLWSVTTADSQRIRKDQNDLSNPGAQQRVESISAQQEDCFVMEERKLSKITCLKHVEVGVKLKEKSEREVRLPSFNDVLVRDAGVTNCAATWPYSRTRHSTQHTPPSHSIIPSY